MPKKIFTNDQAKINCNVLSRPRRKLSEILVKYVAIFHPSFYFNFPIPTDSFLYLIISRSIKLVKAEHQVTNINNRLNSCHKTASS